MTDRQVDAIKAKITLDSSDLGKAQAAAASTAAAVKEHMTGSTQHTLRFKESLTSLTEHIAKMPPIVGETARSLESMTSNAAAIGPAGIAAAGAAAGFGLLAEVANVAAEKFVQIAEATHSYMRVTGESADAASRQIEVFGILGVGADVATAAMVKLEKAIATQPAHLEKLGIAIARDAAGNVDMAATLGNIADAYIRTTDAAAKTEIALASFGKSGAALIPILEQGSAGLKKMEADAKVVMTEQDIENVHKYAIAEKEANRQTDAWMASAGRLATTLKGEVFTELNREIYVTDRLKAAHMTGLDALKHTQAEIDALTKKYRDQFDAGQKLTVATDTAVQAFKDQADAIAAATAAFDKFVSAEEASINSSIALQRANIKVSESQGVIDKAQENLNATIAKFGPTSDEATLATHQLTTAQLDQEQAYFSAADAAKKYQEDTDRAATGQLNGAADAKAYIGKLQEEANTLAPTSPLRVNLQAFIDKLNSEASATYTATLGLNTNPASAALAAFRRSELDLPSAPGYVPGRASGGPVVPGGIYTIGEHGPETLVMGKGNTGGMVLPHGAETPGIDMSETNRLLRELIAVASVQPSGGTELSAAVYKAFALATFNRSRGMAGA